MPLLTSVLNLLFPPQCLNCNAAVTQQGTLCLTCWQQIKFITEPYCRCCGYPFDYALGQDALCGKCIAKLPSFARARAVFRYDDASRRLVLKLKYQDQLQLARIYGQWMARVDKALVTDCDYIVPVPLHYWRFVGRRFNQSAVLGKALSRHSGLPLLPDALIRTRATVSQAGLSFKQRRENVKGAFAIRPRHAKKLKGKTIMLIDDVMTTSATIEHCTRCLLAAGAMQVNVLTLARRM